MKRIILFRFHKNLKVCENRLNLLKRLNPNAKIFGYIEEEKRHSSLIQKLSPLFENMYFIKGKKSKWFWKNGDLALRIWYKNFGNNLNFDVLHIVEWDLLLLDSLNNIYKRIPKNGMGLSGLTLLSNVEKRWDWMIEEPSKIQWKKLLLFIKNNFNYEGKNFASLGPGTCLPKKFLEKYSNIYVPELCHDELRLPLFGQVLGFKLYDTGFYRKWFNKKEKKFFNCIDLEIKLSIIKNELVKSSGRRVFHPFRKILDTKILDK